MEFTFQLTDTLALLLGVIGLTPALLVGQAGGLLTSMEPPLELLGIQAMAPARLSDFLGIHCRGLDHGLLAFLGVARHVRLLSPPGC